MIEFEDTDGDSVYSPSKDKEVKVTHLNLKDLSKIWQCNKYATVPIKSSASGGNSSATVGHVHSVSTCAVDVWQSGKNQSSVCLTFHYSDVEARNDKYGAVVTPNALKQDIEVTNYPWSANNNTMLAIKVFVASAGQRTIAKRGNGGADENEPQNGEGVRVAGVSSVNAGFFTWTNKVYENRTDIKGRSFGVRASGLVQSKDKLTGFQKGWSVSEIYLTIGGTEHADYLLLDPALGVELDEGSIVFRSFHCGSL